MDAELIGKRMSLQEAALRGRGPARETGRGSILSIFRVSMLVLSSFGLAGLALGTSGAAFAQTGQKTQRAAKAPVAPKPANIDKNGTMILIKSALLALDQANKTGNYTVLRDLGSQNFQANTAARLAEIFASHRQQQLDMAGIVVLDPQLTLLPQIEPNGMLHIKGFFPSVPSQLDFEMLWEPVNRQWRLFGISVNLSSGAPQAPDAPPPPAPAAETAPPEPPAAAISSVPVPAPRPEN